MIDIIQALQHRNPGLGPYVLVLRADSRARDLAEPARLNAEAEAWIAQHTPGARLSMEKVLIAPYPGAMPADRDVTVMAFADARQLAAFATAWTGEIEPDEA
ncbi:hypothetical protein G3T14_06830 [Methylobacterium sp. BTF04]|uniref:hypothetical protein n=1 Tax=Methylobacterium sp. BTF04 TaxID=2708300 RepID=UPI0013D41ED2|nr:hypothetical protein [Methylobacterium sp. BTF04]NEU11844.1 hypothetical protein [Methylobacterium sp. BTF04]